MNINFITYHNLELFLHFISIMAKVMGSKNKTLLGCQQLFIITGNR